MWCRSSTRNSSKCKTVSKRLTNYEAQELSIYALMIQEVINDVMSNDAIVSSPHHGVEVDHINSVWPDFLLKTANFTA